MSNACCKYVHFMKKDSVMIDKGATIIGGCCEIKPKNIKKIILSS